LLRYFLNDFEMVPVAPIIAGITFVFMFHIRCSNNNIIITTMTMEPSQSHSENT
jgi:hypothetical protein